MGHADMSGAQAAYDAQMQSLADVKKRRKEYVNHGLLIGTIVL
jgi:hypothetical protein